MNIEKVITDHKQNIAIIYKVSLRKLSIQYWAVLKATDVDHRDRYLFNPCSNPSLLNYFKFWSVDQGKLWKNQDGFLKSPRSWTAIVFNLQPHGLLGYKLSHFLRQRLFLTQGSNLRFLHLLHWQVDSLPLTLLRRPKFGLILSISHSIIKLEVTLLKTKSSVSFD